MDELSGAGVTLVPIQAGIKTCTKCGEVKPLDEFGKASGRKDGRRLWCRACESVRAKAWYAKNKDHARVMHQRWHQKNREKERVRWSEYRRAHPQRRAKKQHEYRARKACGVPQRWQIHDVLPFCCYWCGSNLRAYGATSHVDHVMPISLGGPAVPSNEVMTCATCNLRKSAKHPLVWIAELTA